MNARTGWPLWQPLTLPALGPSVAPIFSHPGVKHSLEDIFCPNPDPSLPAITRPVSALGVPGHKACPL